MTQEIAVIDNTAIAQAFATPSGIDVLIQRIKSEASAEVPDLTTKKGRDRIASLAVTVAEHKDKRHAQQNRLYWALLKQVSEQAMVEGKRYSDEVWHEQFKRTLLGLVDLPGGAKAGESTTKLNVSEFAEYVTKVTAYAATELGVIFEG